MAYSSISIQFSLNNTQIRTPSYLSRKNLKLLSTVTNIGSVTGSSFTVNEMGTLGDVLATPDRFGNTSYVDASFASRLATMNDFSNFSRLAIQDLPKLKANPQDQLLTRFT